jgi:hypothetical protein
MLLGLYRILAPYFSPAASRATGRKAGTLAAFSRLIFTFCGKQISKMDQRDKELLDK